MDHSFITQHRDIFDNANPAEPIAPFALSSAITVPGDVESRAAVDIDHYPSQTGPP